jgi:hypothetical protein
LDNPLCGPLRLASTITAKDEDFVLRLEDFIAVLPVLRLISVTIWVHFLCEDFVLTELEQLGDGLSAVFLG